MCVTWYPGSTILKNTWHHMTTYDIISSKWKKRSFCDQCIEWFIAVRNHTRNLMFPILDDTMPLRCKIVVPKHSTLLHSPLGFSRTFSFCRIKATISTSSLICLVWTTQFTCEIIISAKQASQKPNHPIITFLELFDLHFMSCLDLSLFIIYLFTYLPILYKTMPPPLHCIIYL